MPYPTEGEATASLSAGGEANDIFLSVPQEIVPNGSYFTYMTLYVTTKLNFFLPSTATWYAGTNLASRRATWADTVDDTYGSRTPDGDKAWWGLGSYSDTEIINKIKDGSLKFKIEVGLSTSTADVYIKSATVVVEYLTPEGKRGALMAAMV